MLEIHLHSTMQPRLPSVANKASKCSPSLSTQIDLPSDKISGLKDAIRVLEGVKDIAICRLTSADVVRHALVQEIINAYERAEKKPEIHKPSKQLNGKYQRKK